MQRHTRQIRLTDVGARGQERIARAEVAIPGSGLSAEVAARYLAGAGIGALTVEDERIAAAARAVDAAVVVRIAPTANPDEIPAPAQLEDPAARELAAGSLFALAALREALAGHAPSRAAEGEG